MPEIQFEAAAVRFGGHDALLPVSLTLTEQRVGLVGANGSGKSTLARLINGLVTPTAGRVLVDGLDVERHGARVRQRVGFIFTNPDSQIVMPTVREDVAFSLRRLKLSATEQDARVAATLNALGIQHLADRPAHSLSGGQKQLLALASILALEPDVIVADEPTTLLDARNARQLAELFTTLPQQLIVATHDLATVSNFDRILVLNNGRIVADDEPRSALEFYRTLIDN